MRSSDRSGLAVMVSMLLASFTIRPLTQDLSFLGVSWVLILVIGGLSIGLRRARFGAGSVVALQLATLAAATLALASSMPGLGEPWYAHVVTLWQGGIEHMQTQASPMEVNDGVKLIFVTVVGALLIITDLLVSGLRRPVWALAPPAALFLVPAIGLGTDTGFVSFACIAAGYLAVLIAEGLNSTGRWTRGLARDSAEGYGTATPVVWRAATYIGAPALVLAAVLGLIIPTITLPGGGFGNGPGGNGPLQLTDPTLDLRRNLRQPGDQTVITYTSDQNEGTYLRMASLPQFSDAGFANVPMSLNRGSELGPIPGVSSEPGKRPTIRISVKNFGGEYLPLPYAPRSFEAEGDWAYDSNSLVVVANGGGNRLDAIRNLDYTVESAIVEPDATELSTALAGTPADASVTTFVPPDLPQSLKDLTKKVTAGIDNPALQAAAIQAYLRGNEFTYSTDPQPGSGYQALENFLLDDKTGYCEQFAGAMAMMARLVGIPSRVAVGFLPGEKLGDTWEVSIRDMHAWPELYFAGFGWVRFEPTPGSVTGAAPNWTEKRASDAGDQPSAEPSTDASDAAPSNEPSASTAPSEAPTTTATEASFPWVKTLVGTGAGLVGLLILAAPATVRMRRRSARFSDGADDQDRVEAAWAEIRDSVVDYGGTWPQGSPRSIGDQVGDQLEGADSDTMTRVATIVERSRYGRTFNDADAVGSLPEMTNGIRRSLAEPQSRGRRALAFLLPRSVFRRSPKE